MRTPRRIARVIWSAVTEFNENEGWTMSGYIAFAVLLALFPFVIFSAALAGWIIGPEDGRDAFLVLFELVPRDIAEGIAPILEDVLAQRRGGLLTLSAVGAIWASSNGVEAFRIAFDKAYAVKRHRHFAVNRLISIGFTILGAVTFAILGISVVLGPLIIKLVQVFFAISTPFGVQAVNYLVGMLTFVVFLYVVHRHLPSRPMKGVRIWPGIWATVALWMGGAIGFSVYLSYAPSYTVIYGGLASVIVTLLFLYITGAIIIFGAEINAAAARMRNRLDY